MVEHQTCDGKFSGSSPNRNNRRIFFSRLLILVYNSLIWVSFSDFTTVLPQRHVKDTSHSTNSKVQVASYSYAHMHLMYAASNKVTL